MQQRLIEDVTARLTYISLRTLKARAKIVGAPGSAALVRAINDRGFESTLSLSEMPDGTYFIRRGNGRLDALIRSDADDDTEVPCWVRPWLGPEDSLDLISDHAVQRENVVTEFLAVRSLTSNSRMTDAEVAKASGMPLQRVRALRDMIDMNGILLAGFLSGAIATTVAEKIARRPESEQHLAAEIFVETGKLRGDDLKRLRQQVARGAAAEYEQEELIERPVRWDAWMEGGEVRISIPGRGNYAMDAEKLLEFLEQSQEGEG